MIIHCLTLSIINCIPRLLSENMDVIQFSFLNNLVAFFCMLPFAMKVGYTLFYPNQKLNVGRSVMTTVSQCSLFYAISIAPLAQITGITLSYPIFATLMAVLILKEYIGIRRKVSMVIGMIGAAIIVDPMSMVHETSKLPFSAFIASFVVVVIWGLLDVVTKMGTEREGIITQVTSVFLFNSVFTFITMCVLGNGINFNIAVSNLLYVSLMIMFSAIVYALCIYTLYVALAKGDVSLISPLYFTTLVFSAILAFFLFEEIIQTKTIVGALVVMSSTFYIAYREYKLSNLGIINR